MKRSRIIFRNYNIVLTIICRDKFAILWQMCLVSKSQYVCTLVTFGDVWWRLVLREFKNSQNRRN